MKVKPVFIVFTMKGNYIDIFATEEAANYFIDEMRLGGGAYVNMYYPRVS